MLLPSLAVDKYVIEENENKLARDLLKDMVHQALECAGSICEAEGHDKILVVAVVCLKGGLEDVSFRHSDLVKAGT